MISLVIGGTRSGKSEVAERRASELVPPVLYLATGAASDPDMAERIAAHRARRPESWMTLECGADLIEALREHSGTVLVDSLGSWVAATPDFMVDVGALCKALAQRPGDTVLVSEEVGLGVHAATEAGVRFADALGEVNREVGDCADEVLLVVAGRILRLEERGT